MLEVRSLRPADIRPACALIQTVRPDVTLSQWQSHVETIQDGAQLTNRCGIVVLADRQDYIYGIFSYCVQPNLGIGSILKVGDFCVATLTSPQQAAELLCHKADELAQVFDCGAVSITFLDEEAWSRPEPPHQAFRLKGPFVPTPPAVMKMVS